MAIAVGLFLYNCHYFQESDKRQLVIYYQGRVYATYPLTENRQIIFEEKRVKHQISVYDEQVSMLEANCFDKLCVRTPGISQVGQSIICLPHRLILTIEDDEQERKQRIPREKAPNQPLIDGLAE